MEQRYGQVIAMMRDKVGGEGPLRESADLYNRFLQFKYRNHPAELAQLVREYASRDYVAAFEQRRHAVQGAKNATMGAVVAALAGALLLPLVLTLR
jgi:hypothetical protein